MTDADRTRFPPLIFACFVLAIHAAATGARTAADAGMVFES